MANLDKIATRLLTDDITDGMDEAAQYRWLYCECSMCYECSDDTGDEWSSVAPEWQWVRYAPRRWLEPQARAA